MCRTEVLWLGVTVYRSAGQSAASCVLNLCPDQLHDRIYVVLLLLQEKGISLMGESSFLASWVNCRAMMMGMCVFSDSVTVWQSASFVFHQTYNLRNVFSPRAVFLWHLCLTVAPWVVFSVNGIKLVAAATATTQPARELQRILCSLSLSMTFVIAVITRVCITSNSRN